MLFHIAAMGNVHTFMSFFHVQLEILKNMAYWG